MTDLEKEISRLRESIAARKASLASHCDVMEQSVNEFSGELGTTLSSKYDHITSRLNPKRVVRDFNARHPWALVGIGAAAGLLISSRALPAVGLKGALRKLSADLSTGALAKVDALPKLNGFSELKSGIGKAVAPLTRDRTQIVQTAFSTAAQVGLAMLLQAFQERAHDRRHDGHKPRRSREQRRPTQSREHLLSETF